MNNTDTKRMAEKEGVVRRIQEGETEYNPFKPKKSNFIQHEDGKSNYGYLGMVTDAQSNIRVAIEGLIQSKRLEPNFEEWYETVILLGLDIEGNLLKLKKLIAGREL